MSQRTGHNQGPNRELTAPPIIVAPAPTLDLDQGLAAKNPDLTLFNTPNVGEFFLRDVIGADHPVSQTLRDLSNQLNEINAKYDRSFVLDIAALHPARGQAGNPSEDFIVRVRVVDYQTGEYGLPDLKRTWSTIPTDAIDEQHALDDEISDPRRLSTESLTLEVFDQPVQMHLGNPDESETLHPVLGVQYSNGALTQALERMVGRLSDTPPTVAFSYLADVELQAAVRARVHAIDPMYGEQEFIRLRELKPEFSSLTQFSPPESGDLEPHTTVTLRCYKGFWSQEARMPATMSFQMGYDVVSGEIGWQPLN